MCRRRSQYSLVGTFHGRRSPLLDENRFIHAGNGPENTKGKIQAVLYGGIPVGKGIPFLFMVFL
jgi:hypothetical protein